MSSETASPSYEECKNRIMTRTLQPNAVLNVTRVANGFIVGPPAGYHEGAYQPPSAVHVFNTLRQLNDFLGVHFPKEEKPRKAPGIIICGDRKNLLRK